MELDSQNYKKKQTRGINFTDMWHKHEFIDITSINDLPNRFKICMICRKVSKTNGKLPDTHRENNTKRLK